MIHFHSSHGLGSCFSHPWQRGKNGKYEFNLLYMCVFRFVLVFFSFSVSQNSFALTLLLHVYTVLKNNTVDSDVSIFKLVYFNIPLLFIITFIPLLHMHDPKWEFIVIPKRELLYLFMCASINHTNKSVKHKVRSVKVFTVWCIM